MGAEGPRRIQPLENLRAASRFVVSWVVVLVDQWLVARRQATELPTLQGNGEVPLHSLVLPIAAKWRWVRRR
jgi:hypothetical protein